MNHEITHGKFPKIFNDSSQQSWTESAGCIEAYTDEDQGDDIFSHRS